MNIVERIHTIDLSFKQSLINRQEKRNNNHHNANTRLYTHHSFNSSCSKNRGKRIEIYF